jgi:NifU-like protein involved in Fe-S cluster formation
VVSEALRAASRAAIGAGSLAGAGVARGRAEHPVCGDELELDVRVREGVVAELAWRARGCPATLAVAACLHGACVGAAIGDARTRLEAQLGRLGGLAAHERHALELALRCLAQATVATS